MTETSIEIIKMLRETGLGWIADELVESLALGRQTVKEFRELGSTRATKGTTIEPFSPNQEMELIVETLAQYFIAMPAAWDDARARFARNDTFGVVNIEDQLFPARQSPREETQSVAVILGITGDGEAAFKEFSREYYREVLPALRAVLRKLWPEGPEHFDRQFNEQEDRKQ